MNLTEKSAYIKGLMEGMNLNEGKEETKILKAIVDLLEDITLTVSDLEQTCDENSELIDELDEDLGDVEELICGDNDSHSHCCCDGHDDFDDEMYEVSCPNCEEVISLDDEMLDEGEIHCQNCGEKLEFDFSGLVGEDFEGEE